MSSSPENIARKEFDLKFRGYDPDKVREFLRGLAQAQGQTMQENSALRERLALYGKKIQEYQQMDGKLRDAVISAQKIGEDIKEKSGQEAQEMLANAREQAKNLREEATEEAARVRAGLEEDKARLAAEIDGLLVTKTRVVEEIQEMLGRYMEEIGATARTLPPRVAAAGVPVPPPAPVAAAVPPALAVEEEPVPSLSFVVDGEEEEQPPHFASALSAVLDEGGVPGEGDPDAVPAQAAWAQSVNLATLSRQVEALSRPPEKAAATGIGAGLFDTADDDAEELRLEADPDDDALSGMLESPDEDVQAIDRVAAGLADEMASMAAMEDQAPDGKVESLFGDDMDSLFASDDGAKKAAAAKTRKA